MPQSVSEFRAKFQVEAYELFANPGWTVSLRPRQCTLGACVISANRPRASLGDIDAAEAAELVQAVAWFEAAARGAFDADRFNHLALMMVDDQLHFHALPRYAAARGAAGIGWTDPGWPGQPVLDHDAGGDAGADAGVLAQVSKALASAGRTRGAAA